MRKIPAYRAAPLGLPILHRQRSVSYTHLIVSLATKAPSKEITDEFERVAAKI